MTGVQTCALPIWDDLTEGMVGQIWAEAVQRYKDGEELYLKKEYEMEMRKIQADFNEPIDETAPLIYTDRADGVMPQYDIRTDRFDIAMEAYDKITRSAAKKEIAPKPEDFGNVPDKTTGGSPSEN